jgi:hypothetical protein
MYKQKYLKYKMKYIDLKNQYTLNSQNYNMNLSYLEIDNKIGGGEKFIQAVESCNLKVVKEKLTIPHGASTPHKSDPNQIKNGENVRNAEYNYLWKFSKSEPSATALRLAIINCNEDMVELLLDHGATIQDGIEGDLVEAIIRGKEKIIELLAEFNANLNDGKKFLVLKKIYNLGNFKISDAKILIIILNHSKLKSLLAEKMSKLTQALVINDITEINKIYNKIIFYIIQYEIKFYRSHLNQLLKEKYPTPPPLKKVVEKPKVLPILEGDVPTFKYSKKGIINNGNMCYMISVLQLLNSIPSIRNIEPYNNPKNEKLNSYLRTIFDNLNINDKSKNLDLYNLKMNKINIYLDVLLQLFDLRADREHGRTKSAHEFLQKLFGVPLFYSDAHEGEDEQFFINGKQVIDIDSTDELNHLKSITGIEQRISYCKKQGLITNKTYSSVGNYCVMCDLNEIKQPTTLSNILEKTLNYDTVRDGDPLTKCTRKQFDTYEKSSYIIPKDMTHIIINIKRDILGAYNTLSIDAEPQIIIDGETFIKQGVIWHKNPVHYKYFLFTDDGTKIFREYNDSKVTTHNKQNLAENEDDADADSDTDDDFDMHSSSQEHLDEDIDDINIFFKKDAERKVRIKEIYKESLLNELKKLGLIYLYRRATFNHHKDIKIGSKIIDDLKTDYITKFQTIDSDRLSELSQIFIKDDIKKNILNDSDQLIKFIELDFTNIVELLNEYTSYYIIRNLITDRVTEKDYEDKTDRNIFKNAALGKIKHSATPFLYFFIKIKIQKHINDSNKMLLINKLINEIIIYYECLDYRSLPGVRSVDDQYYQFLKDFASNFNLAMEDLDDNLSIITNETFSAKSFKGDNFIEVVNKLIK